MWPDITRLVAPRLAPHRRFLPIGAEPASRPGLYPGEPETCRRDPRRFLAVLGHLGLLLGVFIVYRVEWHAFRGLVGISLAALPVHYALPFRWKKPFFAALSIASLVWIFGPALAAIALPLAALLIGVCFLPIAWKARAAIVGALAASFALARVAAPLAGGWAVPDGVWTVLGMLFMFRMILYLYEIKHAERPETVLDAVCYFFLLPNLYFWHFPVVDYRTFRRGYFAADIHAIQQSGLRMMTRGTAHLLLYRLVYHELLIRPEDVSGPASLAGFLACNYLLYLHVSGQFHIACGMLQLFGFQLPETHHNYLLATGFTDYWRRINIYWKDFMVRVVFNPTVFRLKRWPRPAALAAATSVVFVATWALHAYQSFWLHGVWTFSTPDALFWGILGALVLVNVQIDARSKGRRSTHGLDRDPRSLALRGLKIAATFTTIALLWSLWSSPSVGAWLGLLRRGLG